MHSNLDLQYRDYCLGGGSPKHGSFTMHEIDKFHLESKAFKIPEYDADSVLNFVDYGIASDVRAKHASDRDTVVADCPI